MKRLLLALPVLALVGCEAPVYPKWEVNQTLRRELFSQCLAKIPAGPVVTTFNDWSEVIDSCEASARVQSLYCYANCNPPAAS